MADEPALSLVDQAVGAADAVASEWAASTAQTRASLLRGLATGLEEARDELVALADEETHLGAGRLNGELARTAFQLRGFADHVLAGAPFAFVDDPAVPGPPPAGRPHLTRVRVPVGPVAVFSASNFPFAFSVLGGDTASALAAGCPVVVKAHPGHPRLSRRVHAVAREVLKRQGLPAGLVGLVEGDSHAVGVRLVRDSRIAAAAFTGSVRGGLALQAEANGRPRPIPFYGELGSVNPVVVLPGALDQRGDELARLLAQSITLGSGQFCTSPGVIVVFDGPAGERFVASLASALRGQEMHPMLTPTIRAGFESGVERVSKSKGIEVLLPAASSQGPVPAPFLARTDASTFVAQEGLREEVFGPSAVVVRVGSVEDVGSVLRAVGGSLTVTIWGAEGPGPDSERVVRAAAQVAGRVLFGGVPTGVAVTGAQQHGGPFPSSTQPFTTSVGYASLDRFLRPVALQDAPPWILERGGRPV